MTDACCFNLLSVTNSTGAFHISAKQRMRRAVLCLSAIAAASAVAGLDATGPGSIQQPGRLCYLRVPCCHYPCVGVPCSETERECGQWITSLQRDTGGIGSESQGCIVVAMLFVIIIRFAVQLCAFRRQCSQDPFQYSSCLHRGSEEMYGGRLMRLTGGGAAWSESPAVRANSPYACVPGLFCP